MGSISASRLPAEFHAYPSADQGLDTSFTDASRLPEFLAYPSVDNTDMVSG